MLAGKIPDDEKKLFCSDTRQVFHGEFARLISCPIALHHSNCYYYLFAEGDFPFSYFEFDFIKLDNAKAQFHCTNPYCRRLWTSMRARISFKVSRPCENAFILLKIYGQQCQACDSPGDALWYSGKCLNNKIRLSFRILIHISLL